MDQTLPEERWLPVVGFEGLYEVSSCGRVRSLDRIDSAGKKQRGRMMRVIIDSGNYCAVRLCRNGVALTRRVHQLVLEAFVGPKPDGCVTRHRNNIRVDNRLSNLSWGTQKENVADAIACGSMGHGEINPSAILTEKAVIEIRQSSEAVSVLAERYGVDEATIRKAGVGKTWTSLNAVAPPVAFLPCRGERHGSAVLAEADVRAIRADNRLQRVIAEEYGTTQANVSKIKRRINWGWLPD